MFTNVNLESCSESAKENSTDLLCEFKLLTQLMLGETFVERG